MASSTLTSKGQITIPAEVRRKLGLRAGSRLFFVPNEAGAYEIHAQTASIWDLKGAVPPPPTPVSLQDMDEAVAEEASRAST